MTKNITTDPDEDPAEGQDHGVLADAGVDTTAIGILSPHTAQVRVVLPHVVEEPDDEVIDDGLNPDDVRRGEIVIELPGGHAAAGAVDRDGEPGDEPPHAEEESPAMTGEIDGGIVSAAREAADADEHGIEDAVVVHEGGHGSEEPAAEEQDRDPQGDSRQDDDEPDHEPEAAEAGQRADEAPPAEDDEETPVSAEPTDAGEPVAAPQSAAASTGFETDAHHDESASGEDVATPMAAAPSADGGEPETDPVEEEAMTESEKNREDDAAADAGRSERTLSPAPARPRTEVQLTSKRLGELGASAERESSDLLTPDRLLDPNRVSRSEPEDPWRHLVYSLTRGRVNLGDSRRTRERKELTARIAAALPGGARFVPVLSRKGGVGKTTVTTLLGMALADARDDRIIAVDANPDRGTLADRIGRKSSRTVRDLVRMRDEVRGYNDISGIVARDETRLDVLASDADPRIAEAFGDDDYRDVAAVAGHYYSIVLTDTGTGIVHSVMGATLELADQLIIVSGLSVDEARLASETLTWLESNGYEQQARDAVVVLTQQAPGAPIVRLGELDAHFASRVRAVMHLPYDPALATGSVISFRELRPATRQAAREIAARVVEGLRESGKAA
ncbi:nucleotide-binding protein [Microbacterium album]|uniref:CobQ/CobB/MinD/ParA nucleotide binding domain-containing protein n=1 Tax=Microbacterium album TaxID=2053191 RepID=A0A917IEI0_9MICO|nr:AAA family ATPase [Microbacterium album]GGH40491.1 hypothetical protein GCM10010921_12480 [Microbacterium album]